MGKFLRFARLHILLKDTARWAPHPQAEHFLSGLFSVGSYSDWPPRVVVMDSAGDHTLA